MSLDKGRQVAFLMFTSGLSEKPEELTLLLNLQLANSAQELTQTKDDLLEFFDRFNKSFD